jgi:ketosteroid isomerase-like protein
MSLFLQTLVLRGILFREREHRQERISVGMTLWPTGPQAEKKRMKSRLATSIRSSFLYMNLRGRILVSTLLAVIVTVAAGAQSAPAVSPAEARKAIEAGYTEWAKARLAMDKNTIERMLAPDLYVQTTDRKLTRQEFIDGIFNRPYTLKRFDATVLTVEPRGNDWSVLIFEKVEVETKDKDGKTSKGYRVLVARDGWRKLNDNQWTLLSSEQLGQQRWQDEIPPLANW